MTERKSSTEWFSLRLALFYSTLGAGTGIGMPFFPLWLENRGLSAGEIGIVLAAPMLIRIVSVPLVTRLADRFNTLRGAIITVTAGSLVTHALFQAVDGFAAILAVMCIAAVFFMSTYALVDAYALRGLADRQRAYGPVRLWSSVAFICANVGGGLILGLLARNDIVWLIVAAYGFGLVFAVMLIPLARHPVSEAAHSSAQTSWRSPAFVAMIVACSLIQASHAIYYGFSTLDWNAKGLSDTAAGTLWAIGVIAEIGLFAISGFLSTWFGPIAMVVLGGGGAVVRWGVMAVDPPFVVLPALQVLHALSFSATHIGAMQFLARVAPIGRGATAQGDFAAVQGAIFAGAMGASGLLFHAYGDLSYLAMALLGAIGGGIALAAYATWHESPASR